MFLPVGFVILLLVLSALFFKEKLRVFVFIVALFVYALSISPTADFLVGPLENAYSPPPPASLETCDAYVVLGGGINDNAPDISGKGTLSAFALPRVVTAYRLYVRSQKPVVFSGGRILGRTAEAEIAKRFLISLGVPPHHIITEERSIDTYENARYVKEIADRYQFKKIALITSALHMKRSCLLFGKRFKDIVPYPTDYQGSRDRYDLLNFLPNAWNVNIIELAVKEYLGILYYRLTL